MYSIKGASEILNITPQAIYKRRKELVEKGFMIINKRGKYRITDAGLHYLAGIENIEEINTFNKGIEEANEFWKNRIGKRITELEVEVAFKTSLIVELKKIEFYGGRK